MSQLRYFAVFFSAVICIFLFSISPVSSRIYETNDAVVIEDSSDCTNKLVDNKRARNYYYGNSAPIPMISYALNPFYTGRHYQQQPNFLPWLYPLYQPAISSVPVGATTYPESKQQKIACGVGPASPPQRSTPTVGIVGGSEAVPNSWPFVVGLRISGFNGVFCGGSLISTTRILTAAHCVNKLSAYDISTMTVSLGMHIQGNLPNTFNNAQQTRRVSRVVYHKDFNDATALFDVAVLTIEPSISYSSAISPVCLAPASTAVDQFVGKDAAVMGWGTQANDATQVSNTLHQVTLKVVSLADCNVPYENGIKPQQICAKADGKDACSGDSGGPLVVQRSGSSWTQAGIVSFGQACADPTFPSVYANVAFFRNWINTYMKI